MHSLHLLSEPERKDLLRRAILNRVPDISPCFLACICDSVNSKRRYFIKHTSDKQRFLNLATQETIVSDDLRVFSVVLPVCGYFQAPYFEKTGTHRNATKGELDISAPVAAIKIRAGNEKQLSSATYSLLIFIPDQKTNSTTK